MFQVGANGQATLLTPLEQAWHFRELIRAVVRRELAARFRGSILGWLWAIFGPLLMLSVYTLYFFERDRPSLYPPPRLFRTVARGSLATGVP